MAWFTDIQEPAFRGLSPLDYFGLTLFFLFSVGYHVAYYIYSQSKPLSTVKGKIHLYRRTWVKRILDRGDYILAVQSIRNLVMSTTFMASSSLILIGIIVNFTISGQSDAIAATEDLPEEVAKMNLAVVEMKLYFLVAIIGFAFWQFLLSIRLLTQFNVLIGSDPDLVDHVEGVDAVTYYTNILNRATNRFTYGQRGFYFALPVVAWLYSSWVFVIITVLIGVYLLGVLDFQRWKPPKALRREAEDLGHGRPFHRHLSPAHVPPRDDD